jgi:hypothetical protein
MRTALRAILQHSEFVFRAAMGLPRAILPPPDKPEGDPLARSESGEAQTTPRGDYDF